MRLVESLCHRLADTDRTTIVQFKLGKSLAMTLRRQVLVLLTSVIALPIAVSYEIDLSTNQPVMVGHDGIAGEQI